jgi:hypothetical protein
VRSDDAKDECEDGEEEVGESHSDIGLVVREI